MKKTVPGKAPGTSILAIVRGAGELGSAIARRLWLAGFDVIGVEKPEPTAIRRMVCLADCLYTGKMTLEGIRACKAKKLSEAKQLLKKGIIPILIDPEGKLIKKLSPTILIDARMAKKNLGTTITSAPIVIGLGPGFEAPKNVHYVIETNRGHNLGRVVHCGQAEPDTGIPGNILGYTYQRVLRAPQKGIFRSQRKIGDYIKKDQVVGSVGNAKIKAQISGVIRGILRNGLRVEQGAKIGDIDPRGIKSYCYTISDKANAVAGGVLEAVLEGIVRLNL